MKLKFRLIIWLLLCDIVPLVLVWNLLTRTGIELSLKEAAIVIIIWALGVAVVYVFLWQHILDPIDKLNAAAKNINEGNLDIVLEPESLDEIGALTQELEDMRIKLKYLQLEKVESDRDNKELISNISHDLKTPITAIKGYVEGIMDGVAATPKKMQQYIKTIYNKANDMDRLIDELIFYSKIDTNRIPYNFNTVYVCDYFGDCAQEVGLDITSRDMKFEYTNDVPRHVRIIADSEQLKRVINNIISNSIKYMDKEAALIKLSLDMDGDFVRISIKDNGKGISQEQLPFIWDRFYRADESRSRTSGSGIGLSIVKKIVEDHGGSVWAKSKLGEGTEVIILLRRYQEAGSEQNTNS